MPPANENAPEQGRSDPPDELDLLGKEHEVLGKARETAQRIAERVRQVLGDTEPGQSLPTEEKPPLA
jgi:hypothetical protein